MRTIHRDIVGAFILSKDNHLLLGQSVKGGVYKGEWIVPGGGIEPGETKLQAVLREVKEEVGIDISTAVIESVSGNSTGESEKVLRDTGEHVLVKMTFYDYIVRLPQNAADTPVTLEDDLAKAEWFSLARLPEIPLARATKEMLQKLGIL